METNLISEIWIVLSCKKRSRVFFHLSNQAVASGSNSALKHNTDYLLSDMDEDLEVT